ncbi:MAG: hypothetical protein AAFR68_22510 [Pseudomonadota bacterium]
MTKFDYGDTVRVRDEAPKRYLPGSLASICSVTRVETPSHALATGAEIGDTVHTVEFIDGSSIELSAKWLMRAER